MLLVVPSQGWVCPQCTPTAPHAPRHAPHTRNDVRIACPLCEQAGGSRQVQCQACCRPYHLLCLGLHSSAFPVGEFVCAPCHLLACKVANPNEQAVNAANMLIYLQGNRIQTRSMDTYASALHRYLDFAVNVMGKPRHLALPSGRAGVVSTEDLKLFIAHAASKYKVSTIMVTICALVDWHKSKGAPADSVSPALPEIKTLIKSVSTLQGPAGLPVGKVGMPKSILRLTLAWLASHTNLSLRPLHIRDAAWLVLGFFGLLRRSELVALCVQDLSLHSGPQPHISVLIRHSKADQRMAGVNVLIAATSIDGISIIQCVRSHLDQLLAHGARPTDPLFPAWDVDANRLASGKRLANGQALSKRLTGYLQELRSRYPDLPVNPSSYGMHSLRRGGVVAAWEAGVDIERLKAHGRWRSDAVRAYMTATTTIKLSVSGNM